METLSQEPCVEVFIKTRDGQIPMIKKCCNFSHFPPLQEVCPEECETAGSRCEQDAGHSVEHQNSPRSENQMFCNKQPGCRGPKYHSGPAGKNCLKIKSLSPIQYLRFNDKLQSNRHLALKIHRPY